jgi:hypothetical protein
MLIILICNEKKKGNKRFHLFVKRCQSLWIVSFILSKFFFFIHIKKITQSLGKTRQNEKTSFK